MLSSLGLSNFMVSEVVELVWFENRRALVLIHALAKPMALKHLRNELAPDLQVKLAKLQPSRFGKKISEDTLVGPSDQIAWLTQLQVDPQAARAARVEKQRKERRRQKSIPRIERQTAS
jgi:putative ubiquitin-RnfH superfamily antitoxin RatB of RatAB toxin-antitoxin module